MDMKAIATRYIEELAQKDYEPLTLEAVERLYILGVLKEFQGNKMKACKALGVDRRTLYRKLHHYVMSGLATEEETFLVDAHYPVKASV